MVRKIILSALAAGLVAVPSVAFATQQDKVNLCHKTHSETNPYVVQSVNANEVESHIGNGDFLYNGPLKDNGHPDQKAGDVWCNNNQPGDKCPNIDGKQDVVPDGDIVNSDGQCVVNPEPPVIEPPVQVQGTTTTNTQPPVETFVGK